MKDYSLDVEKILQENIDIKKELKFYSSIINDIVRITVNALRHGNEIFICGNGGSAADAQHIATELVSSFNYEREALPCTALTTNTSIITAIGNDFGFDSIFSRQLEALMKPDDILIGLSTSGNSPNVIKAFEYAKSIHGITIALVGAGPCKLDQIADIKIKIPSVSVPRIQEAHITIGHIIAELIEKELFYGEFI